MTTYIDTATFLDVYLPWPEALNPTTRCMPRDTSHQPSPLSSMSQSLPPLSTPPSQGDSNAPLPQKILDTLKGQALYDGRTWVGLPQPTSNEEENHFYEFIEEFLTTISNQTREECMAKQLRHISGSWIDTHDAPLQSWSKGKIEDLRPDFIFTHADASGKTPIWSRVISVLEFKKDAVSDSGVDAQLANYVSHIFAEQVDRLFVNAVTWRGWEVQVHRFDRSGVVCLNQKIDIHKNPEAFIQVIASFSYLSPTDLGWDPTCKIWDRVTERARPSYELSQNIFRERGVYDLPWVFEVGCEEFVAIKAVNDRRRLSIWGRSTFVVHVVTLPDWKSKNKKAPVYILKQCWQRLPGLGPKPKTAELQNAGSLGDQPNWEKLSEEFDKIDEKPFEATVMSRAKWDNQIRASSMVQLHGERIDTFNTIRKGRADKSLDPLPRKEANKKKKTNYAGTSRGTTGTSAGSRTTSLLPTASNGTAATSNASAKSQPRTTMENVGSHKALVERRLARLVFDRPGWPLRRFISKRELLHALKMIVHELGSLYEAGVIHRDVSPANLIISDSKKPGGHIIDFDHSKIAFEQSAVTQPKESHDVEDIALDLLHDEYKAPHYVAALKVLWKIRGRPPTRDDFHWPQEIKPVFLFGTREARDGFFTGTYRYLSPHLEDAPFHHSCHDLDSLWWSVNEMPLTLAGPGGKEREEQDIPQDLLDKYYGCGPSEKMKLSWDVAKLKDITAEYSDYFKDLIPFMTKWYQFVQIACRYKGHEHHHPHKVLAEIIQEAINGLNPETEEAYKDDAEKEKKRREQDKADIAEAISKQMTVGVWKSLPPEPATPPSGQIPTLRSPGTDRAVKRLRSGKVIPASD